MAETIQNTKDRLTAFISQSFQDIDTGPGSVISELLVKLAATIQNEQYNNIQSLSQANSINQVLASSTDTYSPMMDLIAANYNTSRSPGTKVTGKIKVTLSSPSEYNFMSGFSFIQPALNLTYSTTEDLRVSLSPEPALNEIQLYQDNGFYYFVVSVTAASAGPEYQLPAGTVFSLAPNYFINSFVKAEAYGNFSSGKAVETDKELIYKIKTGLGNSRFESAAGISNNFKTSFSGFQSLSVCGANDPEMVRSKQNALGISTFGKADVYVRSSVGPEIYSFNKNATKVSTDTWEMRIDNTDAPGFYSIKSIIPLNPNVNLGGTLTPTSIAFGKAFYNNIRNNEIYSAAEARFTKYQTAVVTFKYTDVPAVPVGDSSTVFEIHVTHQPNIREMQDLLLDDKTRIACADYLVKAVVPCMVSLKINLIKRRVTDTYDSLNLKQLKKDLITYINTIPFGEELHASNIVNICHNYDIKRVDLPIEMLGVILCPDGSSISISDSDVLSIPNEVSKGVTPKTTQYFIDYYRIENGVLNPIDNIGLNIA